MPRHARLARQARNRAAALAAAAGPSLIGPVRRRRKTLVLAGTALALAGAGSASAATNPADPSAGSAQHSRLTADLQPAAAGQAARRQDTSSPARHPVRMHALPDVWNHLHDTVSRRTRPASTRQGSLPLADQLMPVGTSGPQAWMPISGSQLANATTIVQQAQAKGMGVRSAVIAVATAMQESRLQDLGYGSADSLGLFQQRPSSGWGTAQQIMNPVFATDAFLTALQQYQASSPGWAAQPLWASAQGVQRSGFPLAYAQWEAQAASLVKQIAGSLQR